MSVDSLKIWRAAQLPDLLINDHPLLNVLLYMYLAHFWDHVAVVPIAHIILLSFLSAHIFSFINRQGVPFLWLMPFFLLLTFSVPVGLYNVVLWKDIPFAFLIVYWSFTIIQLYCRKKEGTLAYSKQQFFVLFFLLILLAFIRHNGLVYFLFVPFLFVLLGLVRIKRKVIVFFAIILISCALSVFMFSSSKIPVFKAIGFQGNGIFKQVLDTFQKKNLVRAANDYSGILDINQNKSKWDLFHFYLKDRVAYKFLQWAQWNDVYPFIQEGQVPFKELRSAALDVYWKTYENPWVYFSWNPVYMLFLFPVVLFLSRWFPLSGILSSMVLVQIFALLVIVNVLNWRYYYFACLASYFLFPLILLDLKNCITKQDI